MQEETKQFIQYAHEAAKNIRTVNYMLTGIGFPDKGGMLYAVYGNITDMLQAYLSPLVGKEMHSDGLNDMVTAIVSAKEGEIGGIIGKYCEAGQ